MGSIRVHQPYEGPQFKVGDILYLGSKDGYGRTTFNQDFFYVSEEPLVRNGNGEALLHGWLGTFNNVADCAEGKARVSALDFGSCDCSSPECTGRAIFVTRVGDHRVIQFTPDPNAEDF